MVRRRIALVVASILAVAPGHAIAQPRRHDPSALAKQGFVALDARRFGDALAAFAGAADGLPRDPSLCVGAGLAAVMLGQDAAAQGWFERALGLDPRNAAAAEWLGDLHYRAGRVETAIGIYEDALEVTPRTRAARALETRLADWRREIATQATFSRKNGTHVDVWFEAPADDPLAERVLERFEAAYWRIGGAMGVYPSRHLSVMLYSREQFEDITRLPGWTVGAYDGRIRLPRNQALELPDELDRVAAHELVHAVVAELAGRTVPAWLNEGLATALEPEGPAEAERLLSASKDRPDLRRLHTSLLGLTADKAQLAYAYSARAVGRLTNLGGPSTIVALLRDLGEGVPFDRAFASRLALSYDDFRELAARD